MVATLILPVIGIVIGLTYIKKDNPDAKKAGKSWLAAAAAVILIYIVSIIIMK
jgi:hypothetical protein